MLIRTFRLVEVMWKTHDEPFSLENVNFSLIVHPLIKHLPSRGTCLSGFSNWLVCRSHKMGVE